MERNTEAMLTSKTTTSFRLDSNLLQKLKSLAKSNNKSLNNYVETILLKVAYQDEPNNETIKAIKEAKNAKQLDTFNREELEKMISAL